MILLFDIGFLKIGWVDVIDILLVSVLLYQVYKLMKGSMAVTIFLGYLFLYLIYLVVDAAGMELVSTILGQFMQVGVIAAIILFQPEIRKFLLLLGKTTDINRDLFRGFLRKKDDLGKKGFQVNAIIDAVKAMGGSNTGALIVLSKDAELRFYAESGDIIDAKISKRLLLSIFNKYSPLHDGAVIIHHGMIKAARCILPVTEKEDISANLGLRHRAAIGMSEVTDTMIIVVSEETGEISSVRNGGINKNIATPELRKLMNRYLFEDRLPKSIKQKKEDTLKEKVIPEKESA